MTFKIWGTENLVRTVPNVSVDLSSVTPLANGGYVVSWREGSAKVGFQVYDGLGVPVSAPQFVEPVDAGQTVRSADIQAFGNDGRFAVTWSEGGVSNVSIYNRVYRPDGTPVNDHSAIATGTGKLGAQTAANGSGGWGTAYIDDGFVKFVAYDGNGTSGTPLGVEVAGGSTGLDVTWLGGARYLVAYQGNNDTMLRVVDTENSSVTSLNSLPTVARVDVIGLMDPVTGAPSGGYIVLMENGTSVTAQRFHANNQPDGGPVVITDSKPNSDFDAVSAVALRGGGYALTYISADEGDFGDVFVAVFNEDGTSRTMKVNERANLDSVGSQRTPSISEMKDGRLALSWWDPTGSAGNGSNIPSTVVDARTEAVIVNGTTGADIYVGTEYAADALSGNAGNDILIGGEGGDVIDGGDDVDVASFQYATAGVVANLATGGTGGEAAGDTYTDIENFLGSAFGDNLTGDDAANHIDGAGGNDTLNGGGGLDTLVGDAGDDVLDGGTEEDVLDGGAGNDALNGNEGADVMNGGTGNDVYHVNDAGDVVTESGAADGGVDGVYSSVTYTLTAFVENLVGTGTDAINLTGNDRNNTIVGNAAANVIVGAAGNDILNGGGGDDNIDGGIGDDHLDGSDGNDILSSGAGNDALYGGLGNDALRGADGNDHLDGGDGSDNLDAGEGFDVLLGGTGDDALAGAGGNDHLDGGDGFDHLDGGEGFDTLFGGTGDDGLIGAGGNDNLNGDDGNDNLDGGNGDDVLNGGTGVDVMNGGLGNDSYHNDNAGDMVIDGGGIDTVVVSIAYDISKLATMENITGAGAASITLTGNNMNNVLTGNAGANIIDGAKGNDTLFGGAGNDRLYGGNGKDVLWGGSGRDTFVFNKKPNKKFKTKIEDFNVREDSFFVENKYFKVGKKGSIKKPAKMASKMFYKGKKAHDKDDRFIYDNKKGELWYDADGSGGKKAILLADLDKNLKITHKDFFVI